MAKAKRVETTVAPAHTSAPAAPAPVSPAPVAFADTEQARLYGVAMLKMALELKKPGASPLEEVISSVLSRMRLDEAQFRRYLQQNGGLLKAIAERRV